MTGKIIKPAYEGVEEVYKARLVVIGSGQKFGRDYEETFGPVPHSESVKVVLSECASQNMKVICNLISAQHFFMLISIT